MSNIIFTGGNGGDANDRSQSGKQKPIPNRKHVSHGKMSSETFALFKQFLDEPDPAHLPSFNICKEDFEEYAELVKTLYPYLWDESAVGLAVVEKDVEERIWARETFKKFFGRYPEEFKNRIEGYKMIQFIDIFWGNSPMRMSLNLYFEPITATLLRNVEYCGHGDSDSGDDDTFV